MNRSRMILTIAGMLIIALSFSSCVYHSRGPGYDYGYRNGYGNGGYGYYHRPPRPVVVVPSPPPRVVYRDRGRYNHGRSNRNFNRQNYRQYGHNGRSGPR